MYARELRIDNVVSDGLIRYKVAEIGLRTIKGFTTYDGKNVYPDTLYTLNIENLQGIPLTPEILSKIEYLPCPIRIIGSHRVGIEIFNNRLPLGYEYLHQLQNLVFALTGEELKINL